MNKITLIENHTLVASVLKENSNIIDLGLNHGDFAKRFIDQKCNVFGLEPNRSLVDKYLSTIPALRCLNAAAGISQEEKITFYEDSDNVQAGSIQADFIKARSSEYTISVFSLDKIIELSEYETIDLLKIDIEGAEVDLLLHFDIEAFEKRIGQISVEFHDFLDKSQIPSIRKIIRKFTPYFYIKKMTFSNYSDVVFINRKMTPIGFFEKLNLAYAKIYRPISWRVRKLFYNQNAI